MIRILVIVLTLMLLPGIIMYTGGNHITNTHYALDVRSTPGYTGPLPLEQAYTPYIVRDKDSNSTQWCVSNTTGRVLSPYITLDTTNSPKNAQYIMAYVPYIVKDGFTNSTEWCVSSRSGRVFTPYLTVP